MFITLLVLLAIGTLGARIGLSLLIDRLVASGRADGQAGGPQFSFDQMVRDESPLVATRRLTGVSLVMPDGIRIGAEAVTLAVPAWDWRRIDWRAEGLVRVERPGRWILTAAGAEGRALLSLLALLRADIDVADHVRQAIVRTPGLRLDVPALGTGLEAQAIALDFEHAAEMNLRATAAGLSLVGDSALAARLPPVQALSLMMRASPSVPSRPTRSAMLDWQDAGGGLEIVDARFAMGTSAVDIQADLGLDAALQPAGQGQVRLSGYSGLIDLLIELELIPPNGAAIARIATGVLAASDQDGDPQALSLPLRVENGDVFAGEFLIWRLPVIVWP